MRLIKNLSKKELVALCTDMFLDTYDNRLFLLEHISEVDHLFDDPEGSILFKMKLLEQMSIKLDSYINDYDFSNNNIDVESLDKARDEIKKTLNTCREYIDAICCSDDCCLQA